MSNVLRGRAGLTFEQALGVLSAAANRERARHLVRTPARAHFIIVPAFIRGAGSRVYSIDNVLERKMGKHWTRCTSHRLTAEAGSPSVRLAVGGTGGSYRLQKGRAWQRTLLGLVKAHDRGKVSDHVIADQLALNYEAHQEVRDGSVGPRCIVVWRRRRDARRAGAGGGHQYYTGLERDRDPDAEIPTIANGMDLQAIVGVVMKQLHRRVAGHGVGPDVFDVDRDEENRLLAALPSEPDEKLR